MFNRKMAQPSNIQFGRSCTFKWTCCCLALLGVFLNASILVPLDSSLQAIGLGAQSQSLVSQSAADTGYALPQTTQPLVNPTEVRASDWEKGSLAPKMKGIPISHFQNEDASFWVSTVTRVQPSTLRVYRI